MADRDTYYVNVTLTRLHSEDDAVAAEAFPAVDLLGPQNKLRRQVIKELQAACNDGLLAGQFEVERIGTVPYKDLEDVVVVAYNWMADIKAGDIGALSQLDHMLALLAVPLRAASRLQ